VNEIIYKQVLAALSGSSYSSISPSPSTTSAAADPTIGKSAATAVALPTPFTEQLAQYGYDADPGLAFENAYPSTEYGIKTLIEDHFPN
jgi:hypothetical protein